MKVLRRIEWTHRMQSQDCWYWMPVAVAVTHCSVSDSRCTARWGKVGVTQGEGSKLGQVTGAEAFRGTHMVR